MAFDDGRTTVTTAGTRVQLSSTQQQTDWLTVVALTSNTNYVSVGDVGVVAATGATERGVPLLPGESTTFTDIDLSKVYIDSRVNGEGVTYLYGSGDVPVTINKGRRTQDVGGMADSVSHGASATSPGISAGLSSTATVTGGVYRVHGELTVSGTAETLPLNVRLRNNGGTLCLIPTIPGTHTFEIPRVTAAGTIDMIVVAAAVVGAIYTSQLTITRVE